jgi:hypothetical protein
MRFIGCAKISINLYSFIKILRTHSLPTHTPSITLVSKQSWQIFKTWAPSNSLYRMARAKWIRTVKRKRVPHYANPRTLLSLSDILAFPFSNNCYRWPIVIILIFTRRLHDVLITRDVRRVTPGVAQLIIFPHGRSVVGLYPAQAKVTLRPQLIRNANE